MTSYTIITYIGFFLLLFQLFSILSAPDIPKEYFSQNGFYTLFVCRQKLRTHEKMLLNTISIWQKTKKTILFVTHDLQEAVYLGQQISIFSAAPDAQIVTKVEVPFDYPRDLNHTDVAEFTIQVHTELEAAINAHDDSYIDKSAITI